MSTFVILFVRTDYKKSRPQLKILINKKRAYDLEVSNSEIGRTLEILLAGRKINSFIDKGEEYYVILQAKKEFRKNLFILSSLIIALGILGIYFSL